MKKMQDLPKMNAPEIIEIIKTGLDYLITGFKNIGFRKKTNERLDALEAQVAALSQHAINNQ